MNIIEEIRKDFRIGKAKFKEWKKKNYVEVLEKQKTCDHSKHPWDRGQCTNCGKQHHLGG